MYVVRGGYVLLIFHHDHRVGLLYKKNTNNFVYSFVFKNKNGYFNYICIPFLKNTCRYLISKSKNQRHFADKNSKNLVHLKKYEIFN